MIGFYFAILPIILVRTVLRKMYAAMGPERFIVFWILVSWTAIMPLKMALRWLFNLKYFVALTEYFFNI